MAQIGGNPCHSPHSSQQRKHWCNRCNRRRRMTRQLLHLQNTSAVDKRASSMLAGRHAPRCRLHFATHRRITASACCIQGCKKGTGIRQHPDPRSRGDTSSPLVLLATASKEGAHGQLEDRKCGHAPAPKVNKSTASARWGIAFKQSGCTVSLRVRVNRVARAPGRAEEVPCCIGF